MRALADAGLQVRRLDEPVDAEGQVLSLVLECTARD
jgi:hypothetical protein